MKDSHLWQIATAVFCIASIGMGWAANHTDSYNTELWQENMKLRDSITWMESRWEAYQEIQSNEIHEQKFMPMDSVYRLRLSGHDSSFLLPADSASTIQGNNMSDESEDAIPYRKDTSHKRR